MSGDPRLEQPTWTGHRAARSVRIRSVVLAVVSSVAVVVYFAWLLHPGRMGNPVLFIGLLVAQLFNLAHAVGFWWTCLAQDIADRTGHPRHPWSTSTSSSRPTTSRSTSSSRHLWPRPPARRARPRRPARRRQPGGDGQPGRPARRPLHPADPAPRRQGRQHQRRPWRHTSAPYVLVLDCDHVPHPDFLVRTLRGSTTRTSPSCRRRSTTPTTTSNTIAAASWAQQALFFGPIAQRQGRSRRHVLLWHERRVPAHRARGCGRVSRGVDHRGLPALDPAP